MCIRTHRCSPAESCVGMSCNKDNMSALIISGRCRCVRYEVSVKYPVTAKYPVNVMDPVNVKYPVNVTDSVNVTDLSNTKYPVNGILLMRSSRLM